MNIIRILSVLFFTSITISSYSQQNPFMNDGNGRPLYLRTNYIPEGSPYLYDEFCTAEITTMAGKVYTDVKVKFDLIEKELIYLDDKNESMVTSTPIKKIKLSSFVNNETFHEAVTIESHNMAINSPNTPVYAVLEDGNAKLYKQMLVTYTDLKKYGEATITRTFKRVENFYAVLPGKDTVIRIEKNKTAVAALFGDKQASINSFIEQQKLKCKSQADLIAVFKYYNSL